MAALDRAPGHAPRPAGTYARHVAPPTLFTVFDVAQRLGLGVRQTRNILKAYKIPVGYLERKVKIPNGMILKRRVAIVSPSGLERAILSYMGIPATRRPAGDPR